MLLLQRAPGWFSVHTAFCNSTSESSDSLFWPLWVLQAHGADTYTQANTHSDVLPSCPRGHFQVTQDATRNGLPKISTVFGCPPCRISLYLCLPTPCHLQSPFCSVNVLSLPAKDSDFLPTTACIHRALLALTASSGLLLDDPPGMIQPRRPCSLTQEPQSLSQPGTCDNL